MSKKEKELFEVFWQHLMDTDAYLNFCDDSIKYTAKIAWYAGYKEVRR